jgi:hypothetical protein
MVKIQTQVSDKKVPAAKVVKAEAGRPAKEGQRLPTPRGEEEVLEVFEEGGRIKKGSFISNLLVRAAILAFINLIGIASIVYFAQKIPTKAEEVKSLRNEQLGIGTQDLEVIKKDIEGNSQKADKVLALFPNDEGLVVFVNELDKIKKEGKIVGFSFAAENAIKDKTGNLGIPVLIEINGTWAEIDSDLQKIQRLPFLLRAIEVEAQPAEEEGLINFKFGGFLYVGKDFGKN